MESFLKASKVALSDLSPYQIIRVILGNQTCDLDSAVCALAQGFSEYVNAKKHGQSDLAVIPVLNIPEKEFRIKTEVVYWLRSHNIPLYLITFRDQINLQNLQNKTDKKLELILVDHHILPNEDIVLKPSVTNIIDHRPLDPAWSWSNILLNVEIVGSCTSLVARDILQKNPDMLDAQLASFLIGPILVDTYNMSAKGGRVTATDVDVINKLEQLGRLRTDRTEVFNKIMNAKTDISELTVEELMLKDLKVTNGVPIAVFPLLVENLLTRENAKEMIEKFGIDKNCTVIVLIGLDVSDGRISRDIAVFSILCDQLGNDIIQALTSSTQPPLNIDLVKEIREERYSICLYKIGNLEVTRKQILPIVQRTALLHNNERI
ncbi:PREDICTED: protein prune homolog isoform X1 [Dinoponera quadriceps]|uniref:Protein prune homolog isoform X1 n=1 Tax=Dinoponera quadriceps TaxID=609295 RepID=A0A6P3XE34_DINQU|nr:PREDICTED: protein prune homolog isoform X1 [Dinoponera quadriceps]